MRRIILTGATGGLGKSFVDVISKENIYELICVYRNEEKFAPLREKYTGLTGYKLSQTDHFEALFELLGKDNVEEVVLILNAFSISPIERIGELKSEEIEASVYGNVTRNYLLINETIRYCKNRGLELKIINLDSGAADRPLSGWGNYCASKAFMNSILGVVVCENPQYKIVSVDPGVMDTGMQQEIRQTKREVFGQVDAFIGYKEDGVLKAPQTVARQIVEAYVNDWKAQSLREKIR